VDIQEISTRKQYTDEQIAMLSSMDKLDEKVLKKNGLSSSDYYSAQE
jgi:hypothetical protein